MAPVLSKIFTIKNGKKVPLNFSNIQAVRTITIKTSTKRLPHRFVPKPGRKRDESDEENDEELQQVLREAEARRARSVPEPEIAPEVEPEIEPELEPDVAPVRESAPPPDPNLGSIFNDGDVIEPNLTLDDIPVEHRSEILLYLGSDSSKRKQYYWKYYPDFARYYEMFNCWNESCLKSKFLPLVHILCVCVLLRIQS